MITLIDGSSVNHIVNSIPRFVPDAICARVKETLMSMLTTTPFVSQITATNRSPGLTSLGLIYPGISRDTAREKLESLPRSLARSRELRKAANCDWTTHGCARAPENISGARSCDTRTQLRNLRNLREPRASVATRSRNAPVYLPYRGEIGRCQCVPIRFKSEISRDFKAAQ